MVEIKEYFEKSLLLDDQVKWDFAEGQTVERDGRKFLDSLSSEELDEQ